MALVHRDLQEVVARHQEAFAQCRKHEMKTNQFAQEDLVVQTSHLLATRTETASGFIAWAIHILFRHPDIHARLHEEIKRKLASSEVDIERNISKMPYLNAVVQEVLRFHSINTVLWRECASCDATICDQPIPTGTKVIFSHWTSNRDAVVWGPDARIFHPD